MNLRVSVSKLEDFRKVSETEWARESMLLDSIRNPTPLGWQARYGEALHAAIEDPAGTRQPDGTYSFVGQDGKPYSWPAHIVEPCQAAWPKGSIFERRITWTYRVRGHEVTVAGRADSVLGLYVIEGKTRFGPVEPIDYADSLQWQCYLDMLPWAQCVEYRIHEIGGMYDKRGEVCFTSPAWTCVCETEGGRLRERRKEPAEASCEDCEAPFIYKPGGPFLDEIHAFRVWREPGISRNVRKWLERFVGWAESKDLLPFLVNKWAA